MWANIPFSVGKLNGLPTSRRVASSPRGAATSNSRRVAHPGESQSPPARGASTGISIFMDSSTTTGSPAATESPGLLVIWKTTPVMCALTSSAIEHSLFDPLGMGAPLADRRAPHHAQGERDGGLGP